MTIAELQSRLAPEVVDWFAVEDDGDGPELHLVGLAAGDLERCFAAIADLRPRWTERGFTIDDEVGATVAERPGVASLVAAGRANLAGVGADGIEIEGVVLPLV